MLLLAILLPFVYFFVRGRILAGIVTVIVLLMSLGFLWPVFSIWAIIDWSAQRRDKALHKHAEDIGRQVAANMASGKQTPPML